MGGQDVEGSTGEATRTSNSEGVTGGTEDGEGSGEGGPDTGTSSEPGAESSETTGGTGSSGGSTSGAATSGTSTSDGTSDGGTGDSGTDGMGTTDGGPPATWTCSSSAYDDGEVCNCECGAVDPDCAVSENRVSGCREDFVCGPDGWCEPPERISECPPDDPPQGPVLPALATRENVSSRHGRSDATYFEHRDITALRGAGALQEIHETILTRLNGFGAGGFGVDMMLTGEEDGRYQTFLPEEQAEFPYLWSLLEIDTPADLSQHDGLASITETVTVQRDMDPARLDVDARIVIDDLPEEVREAATRVLKTAGAAAGTVSYAEVLVALENYDIYTSAEYFRFGTLLRMIERQVVDAGTFPHVDLGAGVQAMLSLSVGSASVEIERTALRERCDTLISSSAEVSTRVTLSFTVPDGDHVLWVPLSDGADLAPRAGNSTQRFTLFPNAFDTEFKTDAEPWEVGAIEHWSGGAKVAQRIVHLAGDEWIGGEGLGLVRQGVLECAPWDTHADDTDSLSNVWRLPPGRYSFDAGSYGPSQLDVFGLGYFVVEMMGQRFTGFQPPTPTSSVREHCWSMTSLGPRNDVTCTFGPGPGVRLVYESGALYFGEISYGVCSNGGSLTATLTAADQQ